MKIKFLAKPPGTDYERDQVAEFNSNDWVEMTYAEKYLREGLAEEVMADTPTAAEAETPASPDSAAAPAEGTDGAAAPPSGAQPAASGRGARGAKNK